MEISLLCLFSTTHNVIFFNICFFWLANGAFAVETNHEVNFQLVSIVSNFAENVEFNPPSQVSDCRATKERC